MVYRYMKRNVNADVVNLISVFRIGVGLDVIPHVTIITPGMLCVPLCVF